MTNRTILWRYDSDTEYSSSSWEDCYRVLRLRDWIPSYDVWAPKLGFPDDPKDKTKVLNIPHMLKFTFGGKPYEGVFNNLSALDANTPELITQNFGDFHYTDWRTVEHFLPNQFAIDTMRKLYSEGTFFLFGMLLSNLVDFSPDLKASLPDTFDEQSGEMIVPPKKPGDPYSIAIHSRHSQAEDNGCGVHHEVHCLHKLLSGRADTTSSNNTCIVYVASDRACTLSTLQEKIPHDFPQCQVAIAKHSNPKPGKDKVKWSEHGPVSTQSIYCIPLIVLQAIFAVLYAAWPLNTNNLDFLRFCCRIRFMTISAVRRLWVPAGSCFYRSEGTGCCCCHNGKCKSHQHSRKGEVKFLAHGGTYGIQPKDGTE